VFIFIGCVLVGVGLLVLPGQVSATDEQRYF